MSEAEKIYHYEWDLLMERMEMLKNHNELKLEDEKNC